jgi:hypothetical protein
VRYYASQAGLPNLWVRYHVSLGQKGHIVHLSSWCGEDILESDAAQNPPERFWQASESGTHAPAGTKLVLEATFRDGAGSTRWRCTNGARRSELPRGRNIAVPTLWRSSVTVPAARRRHSAANFLPVPVPRCLIKNSFSFPLNEPSRRYRPGL